MDRQLSFLEVLEQRIAPAAVTTFTDTDGDTVQVTSSKGTLNELNAALNVTMGQLESLDVNTNTFAGASITIKVIERGANGNGVVNVGVINGAGVDLGAVRVEGDLGQIVAGDSNYKTAGLKSLYVHSLGEMGMTTGATNFVSEVEGSIGTIKVLGDMQEAGIVADNNATDFKANIGKIHVGGSLRGGDTVNEGSINADGDLGTVFVGGDLIGGSNTDTGTIKGYKMKDVTVLGDLTATSGASGAASLYSGSGYGKIYIGGSLNGSAMDSFFSSASIYSGSVGAKSVYIGGSINGGTGDSGAMVTLNGTVGSLYIGGDVSGDGNSSGSIRGGNFGKVVIKGGLFGGDEAQSGLLISSYFKSVEVFGGLHGGAGLTSGMVYSNGDLGTVNIHGDLEGGSGKFSGSLVIIKNFSTVKVHGSLTGGQYMDMDHTGETSGGIYISPVGFTSDHAVGSIWVDGSVTGGSGAQSGAIAVFGNAKSINVAGSLIGGSAAHAGRIVSYGAGTIAVDGDVVGGSVANTGYILGADKFVKSLKVGGALVSGTASASGWITMQSDLGSGEIAGDIAGGDDRNNSGQFIVLGNLTGKFSVGGSILGGDRATSSGIVDVQGHAKELWIGGSIVGGGASNGSDYINSGSLLVGSATKITVQGSVLGGQDSNNSDVLNSGAVRAVKTIDSLNIKGDVLGGIGSTGIAATISAGGNYTDGAKSNLAIKNLVIGGNVQNAMILSGYGVTGSGLNGSGAVANGDTAQLGNITVEGNFISSSVVAGATTGMTQFWGSATNVLLPETAGSNIVASIASLVVNGTLSGTMNGAPNAIVAERIEHLSTGGLDVTPASGDINQYYGPNTFAFKLVQTSVHAA